MIAVIIVIAVIVLLVLEAIVRRPLSSRTELMVDIRGTPTPATVTTMPFYKRAK